MPAEALPRDTTSLWSAWRQLVYLSFSRQWWSLQSLMAVALFCLLALVVSLESLLGRPWDVAGFANTIIMGVYLGFLLPIFCLCFGTNALGGDWEERSLVWLLTRPLPRPMIYAAKFVAVLPWTFALTVGGLFILGLMGKEHGLDAVVKFWPAAAWGTLTYVSLFTLIGAWFRHSTVIAVMYSFVLETIIGNMPGLVKRASIAFYTKCTLYDLAQQYGLDHVKGRPLIAPGKEDFFHPVDGWTARLIMTLIASGLFLIGMTIFARKEYRDLT